MHMEKKKSRDKMLLKMLSIIRGNPGIRASEINRKLYLEHSWSMRSMLVKRKLIRKEKDGTAVRYYPA